MKTLLATIVLGIATTAFSQQHVTGSNELTLDQAIRVALDSNYTTRTASNDLTSAQLTNTKAGDSYLPTVSGTAGYGYSHTLTQQSFGGITADPNSHSLHYNVGANFNVYNGGFDASNVRSSSYSLDAAKYNLKWIRQQVAYSVVAAYINALRTKELVATNEKTLSEYNSQLERVKGLNAAGSVPIIQVYQQQAVVSQQEVQLIAARNNFMNAKTDLLFLLNISPDSYNDYDVSLTGIDTTLGTLKSKHSGVQSNPSLLNTLIDHREDFLAERSSILATESSIDMTRSALLPKLGANVGIGGSGNNSSIGSIQLFHSLTGGLNLSVPIYDAAQNRLQIDIQQVQLESSRIRLQQAEEQFRSDISKAENNLHSAEQTVAATEVELQSAEESLRAATERLKVGAGIQLDVIVAEAQVQTARTDRVNALYNYLLVTRQLEYLLGKTNY
ncbi:MAG: TolC family protein [bacterium]